MWNSLSGEITYRSATHVYLMTGGGMEWSLAVSGTTLSNLGGKTSNVRLFTYLQHKEDEMSIFGFLDEAERTMFLSLLSVNGVGAKASLRILSAFSPARLQETLENDDINALSSVKGLGKKTAQKILLALKGKLVWADESAGDSAWLNDILQSLTSMGFESKKVQIALKEVCKNLDLGDMDSSEREKQVFSQTLLILSSGR